MKTKVNAAKYLAIGLFALVPMTANAADLTLVSWGGQYQDKAREAWWDPIAEKLGITYDEDTIKNVSELRTQVQSGNVAWDIVDLGGYGCDQAANEGLLEKLDYSVIDPGNIRKDIVTDYYIGVLEYSLGLAYNKDHFKGNPPRSWADFWDVKNFPGSRAMLSRPNFMIEMALLADGVPDSELYPLDLDRAFKKLEEIKPDIKVFYLSGGQGTQLVRDREADMVAIYANRARDAINDGAPYEVQSNQAIVDIDCYIIPKGAKNKDIAMKFIAEVVKPQMNARIGNYDDLSPANSDSLQFVPEDKRAELTSNPSNRGKYVFLSQAWWGQNLKAVTERYTAYVAQ